MNPKFPFFLHGGDYNPDQWRHIPGTVDEDFRLFPLAGINSASVGIAAVAASLHIPIVENPCPEDKGSKRYEIKKLLSQMSKDYPDLKSKIFGAMQRMPLPGWEIHS